MRAALDRAPTEKYRARMLAVADRLFDEFGHLSFLAIAEAMNAVRREASTYPGSREPDPETVYRLARSALLDQAKAG